MLKNYLWFIYALCAAVLWGLQYATIEQLLKTIPAPLITLIYFTASAVVYILIFPFFTTELGLEYFHKYWTQKSIWQIVIVVLVGAISTILTFSAIAEGTATKASLVEISYPFFVALFAIFLYREETFNLQTFLGGVFILLGITIVLKS